MRVQRTRALASLGSLAADAPPVGRAEVTVSRLTVGVQSPRAQPVQAHDGTTGYYDVVFDEEEQA
jgi:hypothetical protein